MSEETKQVKLYFLCGPGIGILDSWLPVLTKLKQSLPKAEFVCCFSKGNNIEHIHPREITITLAEKIFDSALVCLPSGLWVWSHSLLALPMRYAASRQEQFLIGIIKRLVSRRWLKWLCKPLQGKLKNIQRRRYARDLVALKDLATANAMLLYDVYEETKAYNRSFLRHLDQVAKFSLCHGIDINQDPIVKRYLHSRRQDRLQAYLFSAEEIPYYQGTYALSDKQLQVVGVPRHDPSWVEYLCSQVQLDFSWDNCVLLISRPALPYLPFERKRQQLKNIKKIIIDELGLKLVVKRHPKEAASPVFAEIFGEENLGVTWCYANAHPMVIAKQSRFAITFYSGVAVDMLYLGVPVIEYLDLRGLPEYDTASALRDDKGEPVFSYRHLGLVEGVSTLEDLRQVATMMHNNPQQAHARLFAKYQQYFPATDAAAKIVGDILKSLGNAGFCHPGLEPGSSRKLDRSRLKAGMTRTSRLNDEEYHHEY